MSFFLNPFQFSKLFSLPCWSLSKTWWLPLAWKFRWQVRFLWTWMLQAQLPNFTWRHSLQLTSLGLGIQLRCSQGLVGFRWLPQHARRGSHMHQRQRRFQSNISVMWVPISLCLCFRPVWFYSHTLMAAIVRRSEFCSPNLRQTLSKNGCSWRSKLAWNV